MSTVADEPTEASLGQMTLIEHLGEFRNRLLKSLGAIVVAMVVMWFFYEPVIATLKDPLCEALPEGQECQLIVTDVLQNFSTRLNVSAYGGTMIAFPVILWQIWRFITPGLYKREKRLALPFMFFGILLFFLGAAMAFWTWPKALQWLIDVGGPDVVPYFTVNSYVATVVKIMLAFGISFEFPIFLVFLQLLGLVTPEKLGSMRRYAIVGIVVFVAVITPQGDPVTLAALSVPMYLFFEISIIIGKIAAKRKAKREASAS